VRDSNQPGFLLFYRKKVAKSSVQGLRNGAPLLKTDRFGDPTPQRRLPYGAPFSVRCACPLNMHQRKILYTRCFFRTLSPLRRTVGRISAWAEGTEIKKADYY